MTAKKISGSLTITDGAEKTQIPDVSRPLLEALYATVTSASDTLNQKRRLPSIVGPDDIEQLVAQLDQWSQPFDPISRNIRISVSSSSPEEVQVGAKAFCI